MAASRRILELNAGHPLIENLSRLVELEPESEAVVPWIETLYDQVLLAEGSPLEDPNRLARRMTELMQQATAAALQS